MKRLGLTIRGRIAIATSILTVSSHAVYIESSKLQHRREVEARYDPKKPNPFLEDLADNVSDGDILLFARRWYHHHLPMACLLAAYHYMHGTEYDHTGIIIRDEKGEPFVSEIRPFGRPVLRKLEDRILYSRSHQISLIALYPRNNMAKSKRREIFQQIKDKQARYESWSMAGGLLAALGRVCGIEYFDSIPLCPSTRFSLDSLNLMGINFIKLGESDNAISCGDIMNRDIRDTHREFTLDDSTVLVKMR